MSVLSRAPTTLPCVSGRRRWSRLAGVVLLVTACAPSSPAALTDAEMTGRWRGTIRLLDRDSVFGQFVDVCGAGVCRGLMDGARDTVRFDYTLAGDSATAVSGPFPVRSRPGVLLRDRWVVHRTAPGRLEGVGATHLADRDDSVVFRYRLEVVQQK